VDWVVHRINIQADPSVHHLTDVESIKPKQGSLLDHVPPVAKLLEVLLGSLVDSFFLPHGEAVLLEKLTSLFPPLFRVNDLVPVLAHIRCGTQESPHVQHLEDFH
jgi:hypothetical protein